MEPLILALLLATSVALIAYGLLPARKQKEDQVLRRVAGKRREANKSPRLTRSRPSAAEAFVKKAAPILSKPVMPKTQQEQSTLRVKLARAGFRRESAPTLFLASKTVLAALLTLLGLIIALAAGHSAKNVLSITLFLGGVGFMLPNVWLWLAAKQRAEKISQGLPDALDLMVISVEAGLGLDAAFQRVAKELKMVHPELCEELMLATMETQMGVPRSEALENMANRTGLPEMRSLVAVINQAERFGTSIAKTLRNQADSMRIKRRQAAEERAQKTAVKLMVPLVLFIFPAIMVVLGGPAVLKIVRTLSSTEGF